MISNIIKLLIIALLLVIVAKMTPAFAGNKVSLLDYNKLIQKQEKCLADNIYFEARNETTKGQIAVALVTLNRVRSNKYPNTICKVVWEHKQFSWTSDGLSDKPKNKKAYKKAIHIARILIESKLLGWGIIDYTNGATHYHANYIQPYWSYNLKRLSKIEDHIFYK